MSPRVQIVTQGPIKSGRKRGVPGIEVVLRPGAPDLLGFPVCKIMASCSKCGNPRRPDQRYCLECHAAYMRENRPKHRDLSPEAKKRANCRSTSKNLLKRGKLKKGPCAHCGDEDAQMHHDDYDDPRTVTWLCRECHWGHHATV